MSNKKNIFDLFVKRLFVPNFDESKNFRILLLLIFITLIVSMYPIGQSIENEYQVGTVWTYDDLVSQFSFPIFKEEEQYQSDIAKAKKSLIPVFKFDPETFKSNKDSINYFFDNLRKYYLSQKSPNQNPKLIDSTNNKNIDSIFQFRNKIYLTSYLSELDLIAIENAISQNKNSAKIDTSFLHSVRVSFLNVCSYFAEKGILSILKNSILNSEIAIRKNNVEQIFDKNTYGDTSDLRNYFAETSGNLFESKKELQEIFTKIIINLINPSIVFDYNQTERERQIIIESVPKTLGIIKDNEKIIGKHELITYDVKLKIDSYRKAKVQRMGNINLFLQYVGKSGHAFVMLLLFIIYLVLFRKKIIHSNSLLSLITSIFLLIAFLAFISTQVKTNLPIQYLIILPVASMLLTIIFDSRVGFYGTVSLALIVSAIRGNDYSILLSSIVAGSMAVYTVRDIKNRSQILRSMLFIFLGYFVCIISLGLEKYSSFINIIIELSYAAVNSLLSPVLTFGFLIFFERAFRISTDITLLELSDFNHPLLKELASKAPGSFHHSVVIGSLAESAAEAIGGNSLLARVGAYYHDIGKIVKPEYFIENLTSGKNKHDKLTPNMSTLIIISHVKEGIDIAKKFKLPQRVIDFIPMHHGTTMVKFFYDKALRKRNLKEEIREIDFRYPGPKPTTKETAIVMLADAIEASVRSMPEPTVTKIEGLIEDITRKRLVDGELNDCNLTINDLAKIRDTFIKVFVGVHHKRMKYPEEK